MKSLIVLLVFTTAFSINLRNKTEITDDDDIEISPDVFKAPQFKQIEVKKDPTAAQDIFQVDQQPVQSRIDITKDTKMGWNNWRSSNARFQQVNNVPSVAGVQFFANIDGFYKK